jgi:hypothetical protein
MTFDYRRREPAFVPMEAPTSTTPAARSDAPADIGAPAAVEDARPLEARVAAWTERTEGASPLTATRGTTADRDAVRGLGAPGVAARGVGEPSALEEGLLRDLARTRTTGIGGDRILLAQLAPRGTPTTATDAPTGLMVGTTRPVQAVTTPPPPPTDLAQLEALNTTIQGFTSTHVPESRMAPVRQHFQAAVDAARRGDYATAEREFRAAGVPLESSNPNSMIAAHMLGGSTATGTPTGTWAVGGYTTGRGAPQALNDANGFAANASLMAAMQARTMTPHNPPTEAECLDYMRRVSAPIRPAVPATPAVPASGTTPARPATPGTPAVLPDPATVVAAAGRVVDGSIIHYSSAGASDPIYGANPNPRVAYTPRGGTPTIYANETEARAAATASGDRHPRMTRLNTRTPDAWSDTTSMGHRSGRSIGDCESKLYLQQRLLTAAGMTSLGSIDVQHGGGPGHMFGVFRSPEGRVFLTSNETAREVTHPGGGPVTQADLDAAVRTMTADVYRRSGPGDLAGFRFSGARTGSPADADAAVLSIRRASENSMVRRSEDLL